MCDVSGDMEEEAIPTHAGKRVSPVHWLLTVVWTMPRARPQRGGSLRSPCVRYHVTWGVAQDVACDALFSACRHETSEREEHG